MIKKTLFALTLLLGVSFMIGVQNSNAMMPKTNKMMKMEIFFMHHSLGFVPIFYKYHPGPKWILKNKNVLGLTMSQISNEKILVRKMMHDTVVGIMALKNAIKTYRIYAAQSNPIIKKLVLDEEAVGNAYTYLGREMIPYHIKGYRILNAAQRIEYKKLAVENWKKMIMMKKKMK